MNRGYRPVDTSAMLRRNHRFEYSSTLRPALLAAALATAAHAQQTPTPSPAPSPEVPEETSWRPTDQLVHALPDSVSNGLDLEGWIWLGVLKNNQDHNNAPWDAEVSFSATKSFAQRVALTAQVNLIDANDYKRFELEQAFVTVKPFESQSTLLTVGKFNADFGVEGRDFWERTSGTPSLLFAAQPQDLVGAMITQPIGDTGFQIRPFVSTDFQGQLTFDQAPAAGMTVRYSKDARFEAAVTGWLGPGFVLRGGRPLTPPFPQGAYGADPGAAAENWMGPNLAAQSGSTVRFVEPMLVWRPRADLAISAEYVFATTGTRRGAWGWNGWMTQIDYEVTDRLHSYARFSNLDDSDWIITGIFQVRREVSVGLGYHIFDDLEIRGELRHDFSDVTPDFNAASIHLTARF